MFAKLFFYIITYDILSISIVVVVVVVIIIIIIIIYHIYVRFNTQC